MFLCIGHSTGTCKTGRSCTAHLVATLELATGKVTCKFCRFHVGHTMELSHLRLSESIRLEVAALLQQGVTVTRVMDTMRDRVGPNLSRDNFLCRLVNFHPSP
jgi:hypothetical protein